MAGVRKGTAKVSEGILHLRLHLLHDNDTIELTICMYYSYWINKNHIAVNDFKLSLLSKTWQSYQVVKSVCMRVKEFHAQVQVWLCVWCVALDLMSLGLRFPIEKLGNKMQSPHRSGREELSTLSGKCWLLHSSGNAYAVSFSQVPNKPPTPTPISHLIILIGPYGTIILMLIVFSKMVS